MNNLPSLTSVPRNLESWGRGDLSKIIDESQKPDSDLQSTSKPGAGLQSLDLGNCSLPFSAISTLLPKSSSSSKASKTEETAFSNLRSLTLHGNPLCSSHPDYVQRLIDSPHMPKLQVVDNKRVKEKVKRKDVDAKGVVGKKKLSGSNRDEQSQGVPRRKWGEAAKDVIGGTETLAVNSSELLGTGGTGKNRSVEQGKDIKGKRKREQKENEGPSGSENRDKKVKIERHKGNKEDQAITPPARAHESKKLGKGGSAPQNPPAAVDTSSQHISAEATTLEPPQPARKPGKLSKSETSVIGIVEVSRDPKETPSAGKKKGRKETKETSGRSGPTTENITVGSGSGVDLKSLFGRPDVGSGLGVGGW